MGYFSDKVVLITGGASGLGLSLAGGMGAAGAKVILADIQADRATKEAAALQEKGLDATARHLDVTDRHQVEAVINEVAASRGRLDILCNNAGTGLTGMTEDLSLDDWDRLIDLNLKSVIYGVQAAYPLMIHQGHGQIVNTASFAGLVGLPGASPYSTTKHAVVGLTASLRSEAAVHGIRVSALCPTFVQTNIFDAMTTVNISRAAAEEMVANFGGAIAVEKFLKPALRGIRRNQARIILPGKAKVAWMVQNLLPQLVSGQSVKIARLARRHRQVKNFTPPKP